jgi:pyridoxal/pyridoxine/pyridoxamine kinase
MYVKLSLYFIYLKRSQDLTPQITKETTPFSFGGIGDIYLGLLTISPSSQKQASATIAL